MPDGSFADRLLAREPGGGGLLFEREDGGTTPSDRRTSVALPLTGLAYGDLPGDPSSYWTGWPAPDSWSQSSEILGEGLRVRCERTTEPTKREERRAFILLAVVLFPVFSVAIVGGYGFLVWMYQIVTGPPGQLRRTAMPADASTRVSRRRLLGIPEEGTRTHLEPRRPSPPGPPCGVSSRRISRLSLAEVAMTDPSGKLVVTLETRNEDEIVAAMNAMQRMRGVVSVALVSTRPKPEPAKEPPHVRDHATRLHQGAGGRGGRGRRRPAGPGARRRT